MHVTEFDPAILACADKQRDLCYRIVQSEIILQEELNFQNWTVMRLFHTASNSSRGGIIHVNKPIAQCGGDHAAQLTEDGNAAVMDAL